jgi:hypothetical protein
MIAHLYGYIDRHDDLRSRQAQLDPDAPGLDFAVDAEKVFSGDTVTVVDGPGGIQAAISSR